MLSTKLFAILPIFMTWFISTIEPQTNPMVEYGALGICAFSVFMLFRQLSEMRLALQNERTELVESLRVLNEKFISIIEQNMRINDKFTEALLNRPCLIKGSRPDMDNDKKKS